MTRTTSSSSAVRRRSRARLRSIVRLPYYRRTSCPPLPEVDRPCRCARSLASVTGAAASSSCSWFAALVGVNVLASARSARTSRPTSSAPNTESTRASNLLTRELQGPVGRRRAGRVPGHAVDARPRGRATGAGVHRRARAGAARHQRERSRTRRPAASRSRARSRWRTRSSTPRRRTFPNSVGAQMIKLAEQHSTPQLEGAARRPAHPAVASGRRCRAKASASSPRSSSC